VAVNSGTAALHLALEALGVGAGDEVIVPVMTFAATAEAAIYLGARPILVDCHPDSLLLDETRILVDCHPDSLLLDETRLEDAVTTRTKAQKRSCRFTTQARPAGWHR